MDRFAGMRISDPPADAAYHPPAPPNYNLYDVNEEEARARFEAKRMAAKQYDGYDPTAAAAAAATAVPRGLVLPPPPLPRTTTETSSASATTASPQPSRGVPVSAASSAQSGSTTDLRVPEIHALPTNMTFHVQRVRGSDEQDLPHEPVRPYNSHCLFFHSWTVPLFVLLSFQSPVWIGAVDSESGSDDDGAPLTPVAAETRAVQHSPAAPVPQRTVLMTAVCCCCC